MTMSTRPGGPKVHDLKVWPEFFRPLRSGLKTFEIRRNDRDFMVEDILVLREFVPTSTHYTGAAVLRRIVYILEPGSLPGLAPGHVAMALFDPSVTPP